MFSNGSPNIQLLLLTIFLSFLSLASAQVHHRHSNYHEILIAHGTLMGAAFVLFMPLAVFLIRLTSFKGLIWWHAGIEVFAYLAAVAAFGLGAWMATVSDQWKAGNGHPILGTIIIGLLVLQPVLGYVHHLIYVQTQKRTIWIYSHIWYGRALILLAIINGGLGLQLSGNTVKGEIAYGVIAGVIFLLYLAVLAIAYLRKDKSPEGETGEKMTGGPKSEKYEHEANGSTNGTATDDTVTSTVSHTTRPLTGSSALTNVNGAEYTNDTARPQTGGAESDLGREHLGPQAQSKGPHELSLANRLDPKVDLDQDGNPRSGSYYIEHATAGYDAPLSVRNS